MANIIVRGTRGRPPQISKSARMGGAKSFIISNPDKAAKLSVRVHKANLGRFNALHPRDGHGRFRRK